MKKRKLPDSVSQLLDAAKNVAPPPPEKRVRRKVAVYLPEMVEQVQPPGKGAQKPTFERPLVTMMCRTCMCEVEHVAWIPVQPTWLDYPVYQFRVYCHDDEWMCYADEYALNHGKIVEAWAFGNDPFDAFEIELFDPEKQKAWHALQLRRREAG